MARIKGHVKGIRRILEEDKSYPEVVVQTSTVRSALGKVVEVMVQDGVDTM
jgi:DNA-binding FrmR family transcriptional regulator